jgi:putative membrane protein
MTEPIAQRGTGCDPREDTPKRGEKPGVQMRNLQMSRISHFLTASTAALLAAMALGVAVARSSPPPAAGSMIGRGTAASRADEELLKLSAQGNITEIELGRLAITRSSNATVRSLGTRLAQDGSKGVANLQTVAAMLRTQLPVTPGATQEGQIAKLRKLHGAAFDKRFERVAYKDESSMLQQFRSGVAMARNGAVRSTVKNMIPVVEEHLAIARGMATRQASASKTAMK